MTKILLFGTVFVFCLFSFIESPPTPPRVYIYIYKYYIWLYWKTFFFFFEYLMMHALFPIIFLN